MTADSSAQRYTLSYNERIHLQKDFQQVLTRGRRLVHPALSIYIYRRGDALPARRMGLVTSRKVGGAVQRNRLKRRLRELFRLHKNELEPGLDVIFILRSDGTKLNYQQLEAVVISLWQRAGALATKDQQS